jgi:hypothetical protein
MGNKPEYILDIEKTEGILSVVEFSRFDETKYEQTLKKMPIVYGNSMYDVNTKNLMWVEKIFKTAQSFYIYINGVNNFYIYYKPTMLDELKFFINQLNKEKK